jgi:putative flippase GtrA
MPREPFKGFLAAVWRVRAKILLAAVNGFIAFLFGLGVQTAFMRFAGVGDSWAYVLQNVFSTQLSFLLARYVTWRHQRMRFLRSLVRYNFQQLSTTVLSIILFAGLDWIGLWYVAANLTVTIVIAPLSFVVAHKWSIAERRLPGRTNTWRGDGMAVATGRSAE